MESEEHIVSTASLADLQDWVAGEIDAASEAAQLDSGWRMVVDIETRWPEDRAAVFQSSYLPACATVEGQPRAASVQIDLISDPLEIDAAAAAERVRERWDTEGWKVSQIGPGYYRADRSDGARMTVEGGADKAGNLLSLTVQSTCSSDSSVVS